MQCSRCQNLSGKSASYHIVSVRARFCFLYPRIHFLLPLLSPIAQWVPCTDKGVSFNIRITEFLSQSLSLKLLWKEKKKMQVLGVILKSLLTLETTPSDFTNLNSFRLLEIMRTMTNDPLVLLTRRDYILRVSIDREQTPIKQLWDLL